MKIKTLMLLAALPLMLILPSLFGQEAKAAKDSDGAKKREKFHLYVLAGGSNMLVKNRFSRARLKYPSRIFLFDSPDKWITVEDYLKTCAGKPEEEGTGPSIFFADIVLSACDKDITIGLVNCAEEGSGLADWMKGGKSYTEALEKIKSAMGAGTVKGILWHQANAEIKDSESTTYADDIAKIAADLRKDLNSPNFRPIPFVGGKLVTYPYEFEKEKDKFKGVNESLQKNFNDTDRCGVIESKGLKDSGDGICFSSESMPEMGRRYADSMIYLIGKKNPEYKISEPGKVLDRRRLDANMR